MTRDHLIQHLQDEGCYPEPDSENSVAELWINSVNGEICYVPFDDELELTTYCHILYELRVGPPLDGDYDSEYAIYCGWRENQLKLT